MLFQSYNHGNAVTWIRYPRNKVKENSIPPTPTIFRISRQLQCVSNVIGAIEDTDPWFSAVTVPWRFTSTAYIRPCHSVPLECGCVPYTRSTAFLVRLTLLCNFLLQLVWRTKPYNFIQSAICMTCYYGNALIPVYVYNNLLSLNLITNYR